VTATTSSFGPALPVAGWRARQRSRWLSEHWRIGIIEAPIWSLLGSGPLPPIRWVTPREHAGYWADPFGLPGDPNHLFCERFDERSGVGRIERLELRGDEPVSLGPVEVFDADGRASVLAGGSHASFPHVFEIDGELFVIAETSAARECVLYRVDAWSRWHSPVTLLRNVAAVDPAIVRWQGRFWLAFGDEDIGMHDNLCLFHAERIEGPWQRHAVRPVKQSREGSRMAGGFFEHEGVLYRPGQDCRNDYGAAIVLHRVDELSLSTYRETPIRIIGPDTDGPLPAGLHTLSSWGDRTLVDGKRMSVNPIAIARKIASRLLAGRGR
jgi:hypothetical protein